MQTKNHTHQHDTTIASMIALGLFALALVFVLVVLPSLPNLIGQSQTGVVPMQGFDFFDVAR